MIKTEKVSKGMPSMESLAIGILIIRTDLSRLTIHGG